MDFNPSSGVEMYVGDELVVPSGREQVKLLEAGIVV